MTIPHTHIYLTAPSEHKRIRWAVLNEQIPGKVKEREVNMAYAVLVLDYREISNYQMNTWGFKSLVSNSLSGSVQPICYRVRDQHTHTYTSVCIYTNMFGLSILWDHRVYTPARHQTHQTHAHMLIYPPTMWPPASLSLISSLKSIRAHWSDASAWINKTCCLVLLLLTRAHTQQKAEMTRPHIALLHTNMLLKMAKRMLKLPYEWVSLQWRWNLLLRNTVLSKNFYVPAWQWSS